MQISPNIAGILLAILGAICSFVGSKLVCQKDCSKKWYEKRYSWSKWRPIFGINPPLGKKQIKVKWNYQSTTWGYVPLKYKLEVLGILLIILGGLFQLI